MKNETKVIAVVNQKGGVGKTTTTWNVGIGLANEGYRVLLLDFDPQGDLTTCLGWKNNEDLDYTISSLIYNQINGKESNINNYILHNNEGVDLIPSNLDLASTEMQLISAFSRETILKNCIDKIKKNYDYVLIDCPPALGILTINALAASTDVLIPVQAQYLPAKGMTKLTKTVAMIRNSINPNLNIAGICMTLAHERTNISRSTIESITQGYGKHIKVFKNVIPHAVNASEISYAGQSIYEYAKDSKVSLAYQGLTKEIINQTQRKRTEQVR